MSCQKNLQQLFVGDLLRIELYLHRLAVAGGAGGDLLIRWVGLLTASVAGCDLADPGFNIKGPFHAPKQPPAKVAVSCLALEYACFPSNNRPMTNPINTKAFMTFPFSIYLLHHYH